MPDTTLFGALDERVLATVALVREEDHVELELVNSCEVCTNAVRPQVDAQTAVGPFAPVAPIITNLEMGQAGEVRALPNLVINL